MILPSLTWKLACETCSGRIFGKLPQAARVVLENARAQWQGPRCVLPDFFIAGAMKAGTSFLFALLQQHPQILGSKPKELNYFSLHYYHTWNWYRMKLPRLQTTRARSKESGLPTLVGEGSLYLHHPHAARRMARYLPNAKIILLLRNPVERTISDFHYMQRLGKETLSLQDAIAAEPDRLRGERGRMLADEMYQSKALLTYAYTTRSIYVDQIAEVHKHFSREQVLILSSEAVYAEPVRHLDVVHRFLGLKPCAPHTLHPINRGKYTPPQGRVVDDLRSFFKPHNQRLYDYLGIDFGWDGTEVVAA